MTHPTEPADWHEPTEHAHPTADEHRTDRDDPLGLACDLAAAYEAHPARGDFTDAAEPETLARAAAGLALVSLAHDVREISGQGAMAVHFLGHISQHLAAIGMAKLGGGLEWHATEPGEEEPELVHIGGPREVVEKLVMDCPPADADEMAATFASAAARLSPVVHTEATPMSRSLAAVALTIPDPDQAFTLRTAAGILAQHAGHELTPEEEGKFLDRTRDGSVPAIARFLELAAVASPEHIRGATQWLTVAVHGDPPFDPDEEEAGHK